MSETIDKARVIAVTGWPQEMGARCNPLISSYSALDGLMVLDLAGLSLTSLMDLMGLMCLLGLMSLMCLIGPLLPLLSPWVL
jgi:hypothetical protein